MTWTDFGEKLDKLRTDETAQFTATVRHLLATGWVWRDETDDQARRAYRFLERHQDLVRDYLRLGGWELNH